MNVFLFLALFLAFSCATKKVEVGKTIKDSLRKNSFLFSACYQDFIDRGNQVSLKEPVDLIFEFNDLGRVIKADVQHKTKLEPSFKTCIREAIFQIPFPKPKDAKTVSVKQPFNFYLRE